MDIVCPKCGFTGEATVEAELDDVTFGKCPECKLLFRQEKGKEPECMFHKPEAPKSGPIQPSFSAVVDDEPETESSQKKDQDSTAEKKSQHKGAMEINCQCSFKGDACIENVVGDITWGRCPVCNALFRQVKGEAAKDWSKAVYTTSFEVKCPGCGWSSDFPDSNIPAEGRVAVCPKCATKLKVSRQGVCEYSALDGCMPFIIIGVIGLVAGIATQSIGISFCAGVVAFCLYSLFSPEMQKKREEHEAQKAPERALKSPELAVKKYGEINFALICQHCQTKGKVHTKPVDKKTGLSFTKAGFGLLTGGVSILGTGLSKVDTMTQAHCDNCNSTWVF